MVDDVIRVVRLLADRNLQPILSKIVALARLMGHPAKYTFLGERNEMRTNAEADT
jgi:hypothetical protein